MSWLWFFLPDEALPLIVVGLGIALILGILTGRTMLGILGLVLLFPILSPFVESAMGSLPPWIALLILVIVGLSILRGLAALFIGQRAADTMTGNLAADVVRLIVMCLFLPFRLVGSIFRSISNGRL
jgi:hypothetical protein